MDFRCFSRMAASRSAWAACSTLASACDFSSSPSITALAVRSCMIMEMFAWLNLGAGNWHS